MEENWRKPPVIVGINKKWVAVITEIFKSRIELVKKEEKMFRALSNGLDEAEMWGIHLGRDWAENVLFKVCCLPPPPRPLVVTQKSMRELWRIIIDESQGHYAVLKREASEVSGTNPPSSLSSVPIDLSGLYF